MFSGLVSKALEHVAVVEAFADTHEAYINGHVVERQRLIKEYAVASCVTRLYAIYEYFVESIISDFIDSIPELFPYSELSDNFKGAYRVGISHILSRIEGQRYSHLSHENVIRWYHEALSNAGGYRFVTEALTRHDENLRLDVIHKIIARLGLTDLREWLANSVDILPLYEEHTALFEQLDAELRAFVQTRNDAAHGILETLESKTILMRYCALIRAVIVAIGAYFHRTLVLKRASVGRMRRIGVVTEVFERAGAFVAQVDIGATLEVGLAVHFVGDGHCHVQGIQSLQLAGAAVERIVSEADALEVGIKCGLNPKKRSHLYIDTTVVPSLQPESAVAEGEAA